ncbi:hypothetical protein MKX01_038286 [Papaver californicum]|nr:hypothetical protein MKX01_038286 [Papaver californicum]
MSGGTLVSCSFSTSGSSYQLGKYSIDRLLSNSTKFLVTSPFQEVPMAAAASGSKALLSDCCLDSLTLKNGHVSNSAKQVCFSFNKRRLYSGSRASMSLKNRKPLNDNLHCGYFMFDAMRKSCDYNPLIGLGCRHLHTSPAAFVKSLGDKTLRLVSGSCYLPHPDKEDTRGEDAHFICIDEQATGVADGVGGWAEVGINAGLYAQELMSNSVIAILNEPKGSIDPARVSEKAHSNTKAQGSSTAGFIVVRDGSTVYHSPVQQHGFNFPYQLECGRNGDLPSSGQVLTVSVAPGDVIVAGTDGLFDNMFNSAITDIVQAVKAVLEPQGAAEKIAALARQRALDENRTSPAQLGFQYYGGKLDDVTVVVSYITNSTTTTNA